MSGTGIIDRGKAPKFSLNAGSAGGILLAGALSFGFYSIMHFIHTEAITHPAVLMGLPVVAACWLALLIPIFMFLAYQDDFKNLTPLIPTHYFHIARKCFRALKDNNLKVQEKDMYCWHNCHPSFRPL